MALNQTMQTLGLTDTDLVQFEAEETAHFSGLDTEPVWDTYAVVYVELLQELLYIESSESHQIGTDITSIWQKSQKVMKSLRVRVLVSGILSSLKQSSCISDSCDCSTY